ncbi:hypothetical protein TUM3794_20560 [Shewanella colwelliana]|uniref:Uncharacterized protein n=1 Tax=Shewanella colwelliana TaxID=23 RepID=A0ABQ4P0K9_SHECO|nr:hypothetical protein TUM3794_20560 [Shewanella colwelliana]
MGTYEVVEDVKPLNSDARREVIYKYFYHLSSYRRFVAQFNSEKALKKGLTVHMNKCNKAYSLGLDANQIQVDLLVMVQSVN